jgi:hypothetical protein
MNQCSEIWYLFFVYAPFLPHCIKTLTLYPFIRSLLHILPWRCDSSLITASDNPGLWFFVSFRIFFSENTRVRIFISFVALYDKNSESDYFFFLHQNQNIFFSNIGNQNIFLEKKHIPTPPLEVKWSVPTSLPNTIWARFNLSGEL